MNTKLLKLTTVFFVISVFSVFSFTDISVALDGKTYFVGILKGVQKKIENDKDVLGEVKREPVSFMKLFHRSFRYVAPFRDKLGSFFFSNAENLQSISENKETFLSIAKLSGFDGGRIDKFGEVVKKVIGNWDVGLYEVYKKTSFYGKHNSAYHRSAISRDLIPLPSIVKVEESYSDEEFDILFWGFFGHSYMEDGKISDYGWVYDMISQYLRYYGKYQEEGEGGSSSPRSTETAVLGKMKIVAEAFFPPKDSPRKK